MASANIGTIRALSAVRTGRGAALVPPPPQRLWARLQRQEPAMADLYLKALESERKALWATCRLKGLAKGTPERNRIAELDRLIEEHRAKSAE